MRPRFGVLLAGLLVTAVAIGTDYVSLGVLLQSIHNTFGVGITTSQWVVNAYALAFAMAIIPGGRMADMYGRRRVLLIGIAVFAAGSVADMVAPSIETLIAARALQGIGAALMWPTALAVMFANAPAGRSGAYLGLMMSMAGIGNVVGPIFAGAVADIGPSGWRVFFAANVVSALVALGLLAYAAPEPEPDELKHERIDYLGVAMLAISVCGLLLALDDAANAGWTAPDVLLPFLVFVAFLAAFVLVQRRVEVPLVPVYFWRNTQLMAASLINGLVIGIGFITFVFVPQLGQTVWNDSSFQAALRLAPQLVVFAALSLFAGKAYDRYGGQRAVGVGILVMIASVVWIALAPAGESYWAWLFPALVVMGVGLAYVISPLSTVAVEAVEPDDASLASAMAFQFHLIGGATSVTVATMLIASASTFTGGFKTSYWFGAVLALVSLALVRWLPTRSTSLASDQSSPATAPASG